MADDPLSAYGFTTEDTTPPILNDNSDNGPYVDYGPLMNFTMWALVGFSAAFMLLRVYCKFLRHRGLWWDDYVLILSWALLASATALTSVAIHRGLGQHLAYIPEENWAPMIFISSFGGLLSILAAAWSKTSFALTLLRISDTWMRVLIWYLIISLNAIMLSTAVVDFVRCAPVARIWDGSVPGTCWPMKPVIILFQVSAGYSGLVDISLALFPWLIIMRLMMTMKEKIGVAVAMSMGVFAGAASFVKVTKVPALTSTDATATIPLIIWGAAESGLTIVAASIPILRALIRDAQPSPARFNTVDEDSLSNESSQLASASDEDISLEKALRIKR